MGPQPNFQQNPSFQPNGAPFQGQPGFPFPQSAFPQSRPFPQPSPYPPRSPFPMYRSSSSMNLRPGPQPTAQGPDIYTQQYAPFVPPQFFAPTQIPTPAPSSPAPNFPNGGVYYPVNPTPIPVFPSRPPPQPVPQPLPPQSQTPMFYYPTSSTAPPLRFSTTPVQSPPPMEYYNIPQGDYFSRGPAGWVQSPPVPNPGSQRPGVRLRRRSSAVEVRPYPPPMWNSSPQPMWNATQIPVWNGNPPPAPSGSLNGNGNGSSGRKPSNSGKQQPQQQKGWFNRVFGA